MVLKLASKKIPVGFQPSEFRYVGRPAREQGDFGPEVGVADMVPVNPRVGSQGSRYFHIGVVEAQGQWFVYMECGRVSNERSWIGDSAKPALDFMFARCRNEHDARRYFRQQCMSMNIGRIMRAGAGERAWVAKTDAQGKAADAWLVREPEIEALGDHGLAGLVQPSHDENDEHDEQDEQGEQDDQPEPARLSVVRVANERPQPSRPAQALIRGLLHDARIAAQASEFVPTLEVLEQIGDELLPLVMRRIAELSAPTAREPHASRVIDLAALAQPRPRPTWSTAAAS